MVVIIKDTTRTDSLTVSASGKAMRMEPAAFASASGIYIKKTYCAATPSGVGVPAVTNPFFIMEGVSSGTIRIQRIRVSCPVDGAIAYNAINLTKHSTASTAPVAGGTVSLTKVSLDSNEPTSIVNICNVYTGPPTAGAVVGVVASERCLLHSSTATPSGASDSMLIFDYRKKGQASNLLLRGIAQGISLSFAAAPVGPVDLGVEVMWTEE